MCTELEPHAVRLVAFHREASALLQGFPAQTTVRVQPIEDADICGPRRANRRLGLALHRKGAARLLVARASRAVVNARRPADAMERARRPVAAHRRAYIEAVAPARDVGERRTVNMVMHSRVSVKQ